jgi:DNA-binding transcriptional MerR regulator
VEQPPEGLAKDWYDETEFRAFLRISEKQLRAWEVEGLLPPARLGARPGSNKVRLWHRDVLLWVSDGLKLGGLRCGEDER